MNKLLDDDKIIDLAELFKIFGDSTRIKIINSLLERDLSVGEIAKIVKVTPSAVSHQLRILKASKLVKYQKSGKEVIYSLADAHVQKIFEMGCEHIDEM